MRLQLRTKYTIIIVGLILAVVSVLTVASLYHYQKSIAELTKSNSKAMSTRINQQINKMAEAYARLLAEYLTNSLYYHEMETMREILAETKKQQNVIYAYVYDTECKVVHDGTNGITSFGMRLSSPDLCRGTHNKGQFISQIKDDILSVTYPIRLGEIPLGGVNIGLSLTDVNTTINIINKELKEIGGNGVYHYVYYLIFITLALVVFGCLLSMLISIQFTKPIKELILCARNIGEGDYDFEILPKYKDEFGDLLASFDQMRNDLKTSTVSVEELKHEIKERNKAEKERKKVEKQLQRAQKMEAVGKLTSGVAHDLNNILSGIVSYPELLLLDLPKDNPLRKPLEAIQNSGLKAAAIVQDLLTLSRRGVAIAEIADLREIVNEYLKSPEFNKMISYHPDVKIERKFDDNLMNIKGSSVHLSKTIMNLVSNAAEAMPHGGKIKIKLQNRYIDNLLRGYDTVAEGEYVILSVTDSGIGIPKNDAEHIFEPFYTKKVMGRSGTGLGLAVVWGTVKDLNGYIDVKSTEGEGTTITLYFPATREILRKNKKDIILEDIKGSGEKILVVDDVAEQRKITESMLTRLGYQVTTVSSGEEADSYLQQHSADLVILDMIMAPEIDGLETYKRILKTHPKQKAIIASGYSETDKVRQAEKLGAGAYLRKPYTLEKLGLAVRNEIRKK